MKVIRYRTDDGARTAIADEPGRIWTHLVWIDCPIRRVKIANGDVASYGTDVSYKLKRAASQMLRAGKRLGITKAAKAHLRAATNFTPSSPTPSQSGDDELHP